jgi:hypothetical protein
MPTAIRTFVPLTELEKQALSLISRRRESSAQYAELVARSRERIAESQNLLKRVNATLYGTPTPGEGG